MTDDYTWSDPPVRPQFDWKELIDALDRHPGQWMKVKDSARSGGAVYASMARHAGHDFTDRYQVRSSSKADAEQGVWIRRRAE